VSEQKTMRLGYETPTRGSAPEGVERREYADGVTWTVHPPGKATWEAVVGPVIGWVIGGGVVVGVAVMVQLRQGIDSDQGFGGIIGLGSVVWALGLFFALRAWNRSRTRVVVDLRPDRLVVAEIGPLTTNRMFWSRRTIQDVLLRKSKMETGPGKFRWRYQMEIESEYRGRFYRHVVLEDRDGDMLRELVNELRGRLELSEQDPTTQEIELDATGVARVRPRGKR
jgi:hypothetical protein